MITIELKKSHAQRLLNCKRAQGMDNYGIHTNTVKMFLCLAVFIFFYGMSSNVQAVTFQYNHVKTAEPPDAPFALDVDPEITISDLVIGGTVTVPKTAIMGGPGAVKLIYLYAEVNGVVYNLGLEVTQTITSSQAENVCSLSATDSDGLTIDVGTSLTAEPAFLVIKYLGFSYNWTCENLSTNEWPRTQVQLSLYLAPEDTDNDGLSNTDEIALGTDPFDDDTDDDGLLDSKEDGAFCGGHATDPLTADTDSDGLVDGTECGLEEPQGLDTDLTVFVEDTDSTTITNPVDADSDDDGLMDGTEDSNSNGSVDLGETDPNNADTDKDNILDGTESGLSVPELVVGTDLDIFVPDLDPATVTNPINDDTDADGLLDGVEDANQNGRVDTGESDPLVPDFPPPPPSISCLDAATEQISATRDYQGATRVVKRKCGQQMNEDCGQALQTQMDAYAILRSAQADVEQVCQP